MLDATNTWSSSAVRRAWQTQAVLSDWSLLADSLVRVFASELHVPLSTLVINHLATPDGEVGQEIWKELYMHMATRYSALLQHAVATKPAARFEMLAPRR
jgi:hypothetical protein